MWDADVVHAGLTVISICMQDISHARIRQTCAVTVAIALMCVGIATWLTACFAMSEVLMPDVRS